MIEKIIILIISLIIKANMARDSIKSSDQFGLDCLIHNNHYHNEYLYSYNENKTSKNAPRKQVNLISIGRINDFNNLRWSLIETTNQSGIYYLKSWHFGDFLCATNIFADNFKFRRIVVKFDLNRNVNIWKNCQWKIKKEKVKSKTELSYYSMVNVFYDEQLYAAVASMFLQRMPGRREIFLWHKKDFNSNKFKWMIDC